MNYIGRFAPSPSGPLHAGSLVTALASWLDARAHCGRWLLRIEDLDGPRTAAGAADLIMAQLKALQLHWDGEVMRQSRRDAVYRQVFNALAVRGLIYSCGCTRREIARLAVRPPAGAEAQDECFYPGTCRNGLPRGRAARAWRLRVPQGEEIFEDRWLGMQRQDVARVVGDIVLKRADGLWAYQFAVVVDDTEQGVTDIVRGADLLGSTARQRVLARLLDAPAARVMHVPLVMDAASGLKLSKQNGAPALDINQPVAALMKAWRALGFPAFAAPDVNGFLQEATRRWVIRYA